MIQQKHKRGRGRYRAREASRIEEVTAASAPSAPVQSGRPVIFAEMAGEAAQPAKRLQSQPLLDRWPRDCTGFRIDGRDVIFFAADKPELRIEGAL
jgi:hypothetical protein